MTRIVSPAAIEQAARVDFMIPWLDSRFNTLFVCDDLVLADNGEVIDPGYDHRYILCALGPVRWEQHGSGFRSRGPVYGPVEETGTARFAYLADKDLFYDALTEDVRGACPVFIAGMIGSPGQERTAHLILTDIEFGYGRDEMICIDPITLDSPEWC